MQEEIKATIIYTALQNDGSILLVFKINSGVEQLVNYRKISLDVIWWKYEGLKAPKSALIYDKGLTYVVRNRGGYYSKILIKILKETDNYCIVDNYNYEELNGMGYSNEEIKKMKDISLYDEIVINPDIENIE